MNKIGKVISVSLFGESHGAAIGITISGLPSGIKLDLEQIKEDLRLRKSDGIIGTARIEEDSFEIISGYFNEYTTGTPLTFIIKNTDVKSTDYPDNSLLPRPSHADLGAYLKYGSFYDFRGGGHHSGRLTALLVILGSISKQILDKKNIQTVSHIYSLKDIQDTPLDRKSISDDVYNKLSSTGFPVIDQNVKHSMKELIKQTKERNDSLGGIIETGVYNMPSGLGEPFFNSVESSLSQLIFSIPGVKGIEFGEGFNITRLLGSQANDEYLYENTTLTTTSFNNGGIVGGISIGVPLIFRTAFKPTSSIFLPQRTVNLIEKNNTTLLLTGRHDPAIVSRASIVVTSVTNYCILELLAQKDGLTWMN